MVDDAASAAELRDADAARRCETETAAALQAKQD
jgi:hypothetical protein